MGELRYNSIIFNSALDGGASGKLEFKINELSNTQNDIVP
jgi:hypothetical protein